MKRSSFTMDGYDSGNAKNRARIRTCDSTTASAALREVGGKRPLVRKPKNKKDEPNGQKGTSSAEVIKNEWSSEDLDLTKAVPPLSLFIDDKEQLVEELFSLFESHELVDMIPSTLKDMDLSRLKALCIEQLNVITDDKIRLILDECDHEYSLTQPIDLASSGTGEPGSDKIGKKSAQNQASCSTSNSIDADTAKAKAGKKKLLKKTTKKRKEKEKSKGLDIQIHVDDKEYEDFLGSEDINENQSTSQKNTEIQIESSIESDDDNESDFNEESNEGWINLWAKTQMEILELEMRARAIRSLIQKQHDMKNCPKEPRNMASPDDPNFNMELNEHGKNKNDKIEADEEKSPETRIIDQEPNKNSQDLQTGLDLNIDSTEKSVKQSDFTVELDAVINISNLDVARPMIVTSNFDNNSTEPEEVIVTEILDDDSIDQELESGN